MFSYEQTVTHRFRADKSLKNARLDSNISMAAISKKLGFSKGYYCRIENGQITINKDTKNRILLIIEKVCP